MTRERPSHDAENTGAIVDYRGNAALTNLARAGMYPWSDGLARSTDPTYGRIDRDIQWAAFESLGGGTVNIAQLVAIENTLQSRRDRGETILGLTARRSPTLTSDGRDADQHVRAMRHGFAIVLIPAGLIVIGVLVLLHSWPAH